MERNARRLSGIATGEPVAVLVSGGLDSAVLLAEMAADGPVVPIYVSCGLAWEPAERDAVERLMRVLPRDRVKALVSFSMPLADLYGEHWSITGQEVPDANTSDAAVGMLGRNAILALKPLLWCGREGIRWLAIATLEGNPFADATQTFFERLASVVSAAVTADVRLVAPFRDVSKSALIQLAAADVVEASLSCLAPVKRSEKWWHCGSCNKCRERQRGFLQAGIADPTRYVRG